MVKTILALAALIALSEGRKRKRSRKYSYASCCGAYCYFGSPYFPYDENWYCTGPPVTENVKGSSCSWRQWDFETALWYVHAVECKIRDQCPEWANGEGPQEIEVPKPHLNLVDPPVNTLHSNFQNVNPRGTTGGNAGSHVEQEMIKAAPEECGTDIEGGRVACMKCSHSHPGECQRRETIHMRRLRSLHQRWEAMVRTEVRAYEDCVRLHKELERELGFVDSQFCKECNHCECSTYEALLNGTARTIPDKTPTTEDQDFLGKQ